MFIKKLNTKEKIIIIFNLLVIIFSFIFNLNILKIIIYLIIINLISFLLLKIILIYKRSLILKKLEEDLILEILKLCSYAHLYNIKQIINKLSNSKNKIISKEFKNIKYKLAQGHNLRSLFNILKNKYSSKILSRFLNLLEISFTSGTITNKDFKKLVDNFLEYKKIIDQRKSLLLMQKYTILLSSLLILPLILGIVINLVKDLVSSIDISTIEFSLSSSIFLTSKYCALVYIIEFIIISSIYLAFLDNNSKKFIIYLLIQLPIALLIFFITKYLI